MQNTNWLEQLQNTAVQVAEQTIAQGADAVEVFLQQGSELSVKVRMGLPELVHQAGSTGLGLRVFWQNRTAVTHTSDLSEIGLRTSIGDSIELCKLSEPDPLYILPELPKNTHPLLANVETWDSSALATSVEEVLALAHQAEAAALAYDKRIDKSDGATYGFVWGGSTLVSADSQGIRFAGSSRGTYQSLSVEPICEDADGKKRNGSYWSAHRFRNQLLSPEEIGGLAAKRTLATLGASPLPTQVLPVVFDPEAGRSILRLLASVLSGNAIYRQSSYLYGKEGTQIASPQVTLIDDPLLPQGPASRPFDGEGLLSRKNVLIENGILNSYLLDTYSARKLQRASNGCAGRSVGGLPHPAASNLILQPGTFSTNELLQGISTGLYVTDLMGFGFNPTTGDFSRGASGFLIENGVLSKPVSEVTLSANFNDLLQNIDAIGNQLDTRSATMSPAFRVTHMTLAGR